MIRQIQNPNTKNTIGMSQVMLMQKQTATAEALINHFIFEFSTS